MSAERIHNFGDDERLVLYLSKGEANAIYALIMWLDGWQEDRHEVPGFFELLMAYRSAETKKIGEIE